MKQSKFYGLKMITFRLPHSPYLMTKYATRYDEIGMDTLGKAA